MMRSCSIHLTAVSLKVGARERPVITVARHSLTVSISGSAQECERPRILGRFPEDDEFGFGGSHSLGLQQKVAKVLIPAAAAQQ